MAGRPEETSDDDIIDIFRKSEDLVLSTTEVAEKLSYSQPGAYKRLRKLEEKGRLESKMLGDVRAWWLSEAER